MENAGQASIFIALGANQPHPLHGPPRHTLEAALAELGRRGILVVSVSRWYRTAPVPPSDQLWYVNAVSEVSTNLSADRLLALLHEVEETFGRTRSVSNAPRTIDMDLLDYRGEIAIGGPGRAVLPHPRMEGRAFVLRPLADVAPAWRHPVTGRRIEDLVAALPGDQMIEYA